MSMKFLREECFTDHLHFSFFYVCIYATWATTLDCFCSCAILSVMADLNSMRKVSWNLKCDYNKCRKCNYECLMAHKQGRQVYAVDKVVWDDYRKACSISQCLKDGNTASCLACSLLQISVRVSAESVLHFWLLCAHGAVKLNMQYVLLVNRDQLTSFPPSGQPWANLP